MVKRIGVLALQGCVDPHRAHIEACGAEFHPVKTKQQIEAADALILPGGESTTMLKLIENFNLWDTLLKNFQTKPVWGICAGSILLAQHVENPTQKSFGILPLTAKRNAYGRQLDSHYADIDGYTVSFIRAPMLENIANDVNILATHQTKPVWVRKGLAFASTFHPELTQQFPSPMHAKFVGSV